MFDQRSIAMKTFMDLFARVNDCDEVVSLSILTIVPGIVIILAMYIVGNLHFLTGGKAFEHKMPEGASTQAQVAQPTYPEPIPASTFTAQSQTPLSASFPQFTSESSNPAHFGRPRELTGEQARLAGSAGASATWR